MAAVGKALLLRVGMDRGTGGVLAPIFPDGTFEYLPVPETVATRLPLTYATLRGCHVPTLASLLPSQLAERHPHVDPDFAAATYGDTALGKRRQLGRLAPGDRLVFYAGLAPSPPDDRPRLFAIGSFRVAAVHQLRAHDLGRPNLRAHFGRTAHFLRQIPDQDLVLVEGEASDSRRFERAIPLGDGTDRMLPDLAALEYRGSLLRSVGHWIRGEAPQRALDGWLKEGPASLVERGTRLLPTDAPVTDDERGNLVIDDPRLRAGEWAIILSDDGRGGVQALARINRTESIGGRAASSLYWRFTGRPANGSSMPGFNPEGVSRDSRLKSLVSWFAEHYRIGVHRISHDVTPAVPPW